MTESELREATGLVARFYRKDISDSEKKRIQMLLLNSGVYLDHPIAILFKGEEDGA